MLRTHEAGTLRAGSQGHVGQTVVLTGWVARRRDHGGVAFLDLRDATGVVQVVARVQVANTDARFSESDGFPGSSKLGEFFAQMPGELSRADRLTVAAILRDGRKVLIPSESRWNA